MSQYTISNTFPRTQDGPGQLYGYNLPVLSTEYTGYYFPPAFAGAAFQIQSQNTGAIDDLFLGYGSGGWADAFFSAGGNDTLQGLTGNDYLVGGSGDDSIQGQDDNDLLYGDYSDTHIIVMEGGFNLWQVPSEADSSVVGNDLLDGGNGADTLYGGPGDDQLYGGPRGDGNTDILTGGDDADAFYLTYTQQSSGGGGTSFWAAFGASYVSDVANGAVNNGVFALASAAASDFFESIGGAVLLGGMGSAVGDLVGEGISLLFGMNKSAPPQPTGEDVMVITDFNPRQDVLFLPIESGTTLAASVVNFGSDGNSASGQTGWGIEFTKGTANTIYAEVFLDPAFLADFGVTSNNVATMAFINDVFDLAVVIDENGIVVQQDSNENNPYQFPTDPSAYTNGVLPVVADTPVAFKAPSGTVTRVYGAFGPHVVVGPSVVNNNTYVAGTDMGDIIFITTNGFAPDDWDNAAVVAQVTNASVIFGYDGDDILNGSAGEDSIYGGDGDDFIYGWNAGNAPQRDQLYGDAGDDTLFAAKPLGSTSVRAAADFDGGDDIDTVSFAYSRESVTASLATGTGSNAGDDTAAGAAYTFTDVENLTGTAYDDSLTGDGNDNVLQGNAGNDTLDGGDGSDTASYADNTGKVTASLPDGLATEFGADSAGGADTIVSTDTLTNFENLTGSPFDDSLTGDGNDNVLQGNAGNDTLDGGGGNDTVSYSDNAGKVTVDLTALTANEFGPDGGSNADTVVSADTLSNIEGVIGSAFDDSITGSDDVAENLAGGAGNDTISGLDGDNTLIGDAGDDSLVGGNDDDTLIGGDGNDTLNGGTGANLLDYSGNAGKVSVFLDTGTAQEFGADGTSQADTVLFTDSLIDIDAAVGSAYDDVLVASVNASALAGGAGDDHVYGANNDDTLDGGDDDDAIVGYAGNDSLSGGDGNDTLNGGDDSDTLDGGDGNDTVYGGLGTDTITGGDGDDYLVSGTDGVLYRVNAGGVSVLAPDASLDWQADTGSDKSPYVTGNLEIGQTVAPIYYVPASVNGQPIDLFYQERWNYPGGADMKWEFPVDSAATYEVRLYLIEGVESSSGPLSPPPTRIFNVQIEGDAFGDFLSIYPYDQGGENNGGQGRMPYVLANSYSVTDGGVTVTFIPKEENPKVNAIEILTLDPTEDSANSIDGGDGNDTILGNNGNDTLTGGAGNDSIDGGNGGDSLEGVSGNNTLSGDGGEDTLNGGSDDDLLFGGTDADTIYGNDGNDTISGDESGDSLFGGGGFNTLSYANNTGWVHVVLYNDTASGGSDNVQEYGANGSSSADSVVSQDHALQFDAVLGSAYDDTIIGNSSANALSGNDGGDYMEGLSGSNTLNGDSGRDTVVGGTDSDLIFGGTEQDTLLGNAGNDTISGDQGSDSLDGGEGFDTLSYANNTGKVQVALLEDTVASGSDNVQEYGADGSSSADTIVTQDSAKQFDAVLGSEFDDTITGNSDDNILWGNGGNDSLTGGAGDDTFVLAEGDGTDTITDFVQGIDLIGLAGSLTFDDLTLSGTTIRFGTETLAILPGINTQDLTQNDFVELNAPVAPDQITDGGGGTSGDDYIFGSNEADTLAGGAGNDTLNGNAGDDDIDGGSGDDIIRGDDGDDRILAGSGNDTATGGDGDDQVLGGSGDDILAGAGGNDTIIAGSGDDDVSGGSGDDAVDGGSGDDIVAGETGDDTLSGGASGNDSIDGGDGDDGLQGRSGNDTLHGGGGNDTAHGGSGDDSVDGGNGDDVVGGGDGDDNLAGGAGNDSFHGGNGDDNLSGDCGDDRLYGDKGDDVLDGGDGTDTLVGGYQDDTLSGGDGNDVLRGDDGDDVLQGGLGNDTVTGGDGDDIFVLAAGEGSDVVNDFQRGSDLIGLAGSLTVGDLSFDGSRIIAGGETLATLRNVDATTLDAFDFVIV